MLKKLAFAAMACMAATGVNAESLRLNCVIQDAASYDARDPIASIAVNVEDGRWSILHKAQSGAVFDRSLQYYIRPDGRGPNWRGMSLKRPYLSMAGELRPLRPGSWTYEEHLFDERQGGRRTYWMRALCAPAAAPAAPPARPQGKALRTWDNSFGKRAFELDGVSLTIEPAKDKGGDPIAHIEARVSGVKPLVIDSEFGLSNAAVTFDVFPIDPRNARKDILISWFTGGAHCCAQIKVASLIGDEWRITDLGMWDGENPNTRPLDLNGDGAPDFVFGDNRFLYTFGSYAESRAPSRIFNVENGALLDRSDNPAFVSLFRDEAAEFEPDCRRGENPACAAFVAASARSGTFERAWKIMLASYNRRADWDITICAGPSAGCGPERSTRNLPDALPHFLKQAGYIK